MLWPCAPNPPFGSRRQGSGSTLSLALADRAFSILCFSLYLLSSPKEPGGDGRREREGSSESKGDTLQQQVRASDLPVTQRHPHGGEAGPRRPMRQPLAARTRPCGHRTLAMWSV